MFAAIFLFRKGVTMKQIENPVQFPCDAQSSPFFCALSTMLLPTLGYSEETPFYCSPKGTYCVQCGGCGGKSILQKHHLALYHDYQTLTGVSFGWTWPEVDGPYQTIPGGGAGWRWPDAFVDSIMAAAGLTWRRLSGKMDRETIYQAVTGSIDRGWPVMVQLREGVDWQVITGYCGYEIYGLDSHRHTLSDISRYTGDGLFVTADWSFEDAIVITGRRAPTVTLADVLDVIIRTLSHPAHAELEHDLLQRMERITPDNAYDTAQWLCHIAGFPIEARWHAAESLCSEKSTITRLTDDEAVKDRLFQLFFNRYIADHNDETHGVCWKIWGLLGAGPQTGYRILPEARETLLCSDIQKELKRLFLIVFENDRAVLAGLREIDL